MLRAVLLVALLCATVLQAAPRAWAEFGTGATATATLAADVLQPPSGLTAAEAGCAAAGYLVQLQWTASASDWLDGYEVAVSTTSGGPYSVVPLESGQNPKSTQRTGGGLQKKTAYYFVVSSTKGGWRSTSGEATATTSSRTCR